MIDTYGATHRATRPSEKAPRPLLDAVFVDFRTVARLTRRFDALLDARARLVDAGAGRDVLERLDADLIAADELVDACTAWPFVTRKQRAAIDAVLKQDA